MTRRWTALALLGAALACARHDAGTARTPDAVLGSLQVFDLGAPAPAAPDVGALYFTLVNAGADDDTLVSVATPDGLAMLHTVVTEGGVSRMRHVVALPLPAGDTVRLRPGGYHVMVTSLARRWAVGDTVPLSLTFAHAGRLETVASVATYTDVVRRLEHRKAD